MLATHGNLLALLLQSFDPTIDFAFWQALTMPDVYRVQLIVHHRVQLQRQWSWIET